MNIPKKVLTFLYPGCIEYEILTCLEFLGFESCEIYVVTPEGKGHIGSTGLTIQAQFSLATVAQKNWDLILIPGGDPGQIFQDSNLHQLLINHFEKGGLFGAVCAGPLILGAAGILKGKEFAHGYTENQLDFLAEYFDQALPTDKMLVRAGNVITAKPQAHLLFAIEIYRALFPEVERDFDSLLEYYRGP